MPDSVPTGDLISELVAGFVAGLIASFFVLMFVSVFFPRLFASGFLGQIFGLLAYLNPDKELVGKLMLLVGGGLGAYWRYIYTQGRVSGGGGPGAETDET